jgi:hypothetical protein
MNSVLQAMRGSLAALKNAKPEKRKTGKRDQLTAVASSSKTGKAKHSSNKKKGKKPVADDGVLTFDQKKDLSEAIAKLDGVKLEKVIQIIHEGVPEIRDVSFIVFIPVASFDPEHVLVDKQSTEEIQLEIDLLRLRPLRTNATKRVRPGKLNGGQLGQRFGMSGFSCPQLLSGYHIISFLTSAFLVSVVFLHYTTTL